ncbi:hypothetical protein [Streptomyces lincolnensis]|uniref:hypothetical protein n=1 Tax=Streptomyces lincolnensis TaxID=1915 RepID=UPI001CEF59D4|nr:hypothetical protein [Streptomyces lincolnensis]
MTRPTRTWMVTGALTTLALAGGVGVALAADGDDKPAGQVRLVVDDGKTGEDCPNKGSTSTAGTDPASDL